MTYCESYKCKQCSFLFADVIEYENKTALSVFVGDGTSILIFRGKLTCPTCGCVRNFVRVPMSAIRLGIVEGA